ncbi:MAG: type II 3-dehydroquinate dehydratase [Oscillospiraceae bacterium]|nr:type II 3-dehydroquinate dehydratase [Oscillospiraceae bacterium]
MKLLILNGPNLNMLGRREPSVYGSASYRDLESMIRAHADSIGVEVTLAQSNHEGELVTLIQNAPGTYDGVVINPAAFTHTSVAILDALLAAGLPAVEVHISNIHKREEFRNHSVTAAGCTGQIVGLGLNGYLLAMDYLRAVLLPNGYES